VLVPGVVAVPGVMVVAGVVDPAVECCEVAAVDEDLVEDR